VAIICSLALFWASASAQFFGGVPRLSRSATPLPYGPLPGADLVLVQVRGYQLVKLIYGRAAGAPSTTLLACMQPSPLSH